MSVVVIGGGLAGLACAYELSAAGIPVTVLEKSDHVGGMASSMRVGDWTVDHGPHRFHTRNRELMEHYRLILGGNTHVRHRLSRIHMKGKFFNYPLKASNVLVNLPPHILIKALFDYAVVRTRNRIRPIPDDNFRNWVMKRFGKTIAELFFVTYTEKAWGVPATEISADWASQRITLLNLWDTVKKSLKPPEGGAKNRTLITQFEYPASGRGIGTISENYAKRITAQGGRILTGAAVEELRVENGRVTAVVHDGEGEPLQPDLVVNTAPLPRLIEYMSPSAPQDVIDSIASMTYVAIHFVYLEVDRPKLTDDHWIYLPEKHLTIHRISEMKNFDPTMGPPDKTVICCEITCPPDGEIWNWTAEQAAEAAERDLVAAGLLTPGECRPIHTTRLRYAYPIYDLGYREHLRRLLDHVEGIENLHTTGRQGLFRYNNMDHSVAMGRHIAKGVIGKADIEGHAEVAAEDDLFENREEDPDLYAGTDGGEEQ